MPLDSPQFKHSANLPSEGGINEALSSESTLSPDYTSSKRLLQDTLSDSPQVKSQTQSQLVEQPKLLVEGIVSGLALNPINGLTQFANKSVGTDFKAIQLGNQTKIDSSISGNVGKMIGTSVTFIALALAAKRAVPLGSKILGSAALSETVAFGTAGAIQGGLLTPTQKNLGGSSFFLARGGEALLGSGSAVLGAQGTRVAKLFQHSAPSLGLTGSRLLSLGVETGFNGALGAGSAQAYSYMQTGKFATTQEVATSAMLSAGIGLGASALSFRRAASISQASSESSIPGMRSHDPIRPGTDLSNSDIEPNTIMQYSMEVKAVGKDRELTIDGEDFNLKDKKNGVWRYGTFKNGDCFYTERGSTESIVKVGVNAKDMPESQRLQAALIPELYNDPVLKKTIKGFKTIDPMDSESWFKSKSRSFTLYSTTPADALTAAQRIDQLLTSKGFTSLIHDAHNDSNLPLSRRVFAIRESFIPGKTEAGKEAVLIGANLETAIIKQYGLRPGQSLSARQLRAMERKFGVRGETIAYDKFGNLVLEKTAGTDMLSVPGSLTAGVKKPGNLTDRAALESIANGFGVDLIADLPSQGSYELAGEAFDTQTVWTNGRPSRLTLIDSFSDIIAQANLEKSGEKSGDWLIRYFHGDVSAKWSGAFLFGEDGKISSYPAKNEQVSEAFDALYRALGGK